MHALAETSRPFEITDLLDVVTSAVATVARNLPTHVDREDLAAAGYLALVQAFPGAPVDEHEARAYLLKRIAGALRDELRKSDQAGRRTRRLLNIIRTATAELELGLGRAPTTAELSIRVGVTPDRIREAIFRGEAAVQIWDSEAQLAVVAEPEDSPVERLATSEALSGTLTLLRLLTPNERLVVARTILGGITLEEAAAELGVTKGRAGQLRASGLNRLRSHPEASRLLAEIR
jgi:RNA polymerase sigma factor for flagellar operon FliA